MSCGRAGLCTLKHPKVNSDLHRFFFEISSFEMS